VGDWFWYWGCGPVEKFQPTEPLKESGYSDLRPLGGAPSCGLPSKEVGTKEAAVFDFRAWLQEVNPKDNMRADRLADLLTKELLLVGEPVQVVASDETGYLMYAIDYEGFWLNAFRTRTEAVRWCTSKGLVWSE
jgi:hypothetical protein